MSTVPTEAAGRRRGAPPTWPASDGAGAPAGPQARSAGAARRSRLETVFAHGVLILVALTLVSPFYFVILASLKDTTALFEYPPVWLPVPPFFGNYDRLLFDSGFLRWMANTLFVAGTVTVAKVFLDSMAGYALAKLEFTGKRLVFLLLLVLLMVPFGVILIPLWSVAHTLHITNTYLALILPALANPLGVFLMRQFILGLPSDLENAARLDGVSEFGIYRRIILPLVKPGLVVLAVIVFTDQFMSFVWPLVATTSDDLQVVTTGVASLRARGSVNYGLWSAAAVMSLVPIAIFFFMLQRQFLARSLAGALKQ
jgi:ABC-type glycerol-3-phosphate transport system permease component